MPKRILIIEDDRHIAEGLQLNLKLKGYQVSIAPDGPTGLQDWKTLQPDLIVLDLDMPVMSGWDMLQQLKADPAIRDTRVVVVTAHLLPGERDRAVEANADGFVSKPFTVNELVSEIKGCLNR